MKKTIVAIASTLVCFGFVWAAEDAPLTNDICLGCHEDLGPRLAKTTHSAGNRVNCVDCHGSGAAHAEDPKASNIKGLKDAGSEEVFKTCTKCHSTLVKNHSSHFRSGSACLSCHDMWHSEKTAKAAPNPLPKLVKGRTWEMCFPCHNAQRAEFNKPYHHRSGKTENGCVACHNPHASSKELRSPAVEKRCAQCHVEAAGPFVYIHMGTKSHGCMECHIPHGSMTPNLLAQTSVTYNCLSCHVPPQTHDLGKERYRKCTACHAAVHGSNLSPKFFE